MSDDGQGTLFDLSPDWKEKWGGMPGYEHQDLEPWQSVQLHFRNREDRQAFSELVGQKITDATRFLWYPKAEIGRYADKRYKSERPVNSRYPIYIVSKGRWESRLTSKALEKLGVPYHIVVEEQERDAYASVIDPAKILVLDPIFQRDYDAFDDLGDSKSKGPGPARNFAWEHSIASGATSHWVMDDNIFCFMRFNDNLKVPAETGAFFLAMEDFVDRYQNVGMAGPNYKMFASRKSGSIPPFVLNTRIYSCNLIRNDVLHRWRGRYNEDTDLSIRILNDGMCTVQFNAFLQEKQQTQTMKGGNTAEFYAKEGTLPKSEMLVKMHPNIARVVFKFGRWHHHVDYSGFKKNKLVLRDGVSVSDVPDDYGMSLHVLKAQEDAGADDESEEPESAELPPAVNAEPVAPIVESAQPTIPSPCVEAPAEIPAAVLAPEGVDSKLRACIDCGGPVPLDRKYRCESCLNAELTKREAKS